MSDIVPVKNALLSVFYKEDIIDTARILHEAGVGLISSTGTYKKIREAGIPVTDVAEYTGWPTMFDHRVATLHPKVHGGILYRRDVPEDVQVAGEHGILSIDLVIVNPYPAETAIATGNLDQVIKDTDIGGPTLLRGAAKNHSHVSAVVHQSDYLPVAEAIRDNGGLTLVHRRRLAEDVFTFMGGYDTAIGEFYRQKRLESEAR